MRDLRKSRLSIEILEDRLALAGDVIGEEPQRIVGGAPSTEPWDWMASLQSRTGSHGCGASLVAPNAAVTAAHCVDVPTLAADLQLLMGQERRSDTDGEIRLVESIVLHPDFNADTYESDIAVLFLSVDSTQTPIEMLRPENFPLALPGETATLLGWGAFSEGDPARPDQLHEVSVPIVSTAVANLPSAYDGRVTPTMIAAGAVGKDSCQGDSGGPMFVEDSQGTPYLAGVISWGEGCAEPGFPGIYARVTSFTDWIDGLLQNGPPASMAPTVATPISIPSTTDGNIQVGGEDDFYEFTAEAGDILSFRTEAATLTDTTLTLIDNEGNRVAFNDDASSAELESEIIWKAPEAGTYFVQVNGFAAAMGTYRLAATEIARQSDDYADIKDDAGQFTFPGTISGRIDHPTDVDMFAFSAVAGTEYSFTTELSSLDDSVVALHDSQGNVLAVNDDLSDDSLASSLTWTAPSSASYFIQVRAFNPADTGSYSLVTTGASAIIGDANRDGIVDSTDLGLLLNSFRDVNVVWENGDFNRDNEITSDDLGLLLNNFGLSSDAEQVAASSSPVNEGAAMRIRQPPVAWDLSNDDDDDESREEDPRKTTVPDLSAATEQIGH